MKMITNSIKTGNTGSFEDWVSRTYAKKEEAVVKTASVETKEAKKKLPDALKEHQFKKKEDKEDKETEDTEATAEIEVKEATGPGNASEPDEADDSKQPTWEGKKENNNDPEAGKHCEGDGDQDKASVVKGEVKEAEEDEADSSGQPEWEGKKEHINDPEGGDGDQEKSSEASDETKTAGHCLCPDDCECKGGKKLCSNGCDSKACMASSAKTETKEAEKTSPRFVKIANLDGKSKAWLLDYWKNLYPAEYAEAMVADK